MSMNIKNHAAQTLCAPANGVISVSAKTSSCVIDFENPENGDIVAPIGGIVTDVGDAGGPIAIRASDGMSVKVRVGTPESAVRRDPGTEGCHVYVRAGDTVRAGQRLMHAELSRIRRLGGGTLCVMTVEGTPTASHTVVREEGMVVRAGQTPVMRFYTGEYEVPVST